MVYGSRVLIGNRFNRPENAEIYNCFERSDIDGRRQQPVPYAGPSARSPGDPPYPYRSGIFRRRRGGCQPIARSCQCCFHSPQRRPGDASRETLSGTAPGRFSRETAGCRASVPGIGMRQSHGGALQSAQGYCVYLLGRKPQQEPPGVNPGGAFGRPDNPAGDKVSGEIGRRRAAN